MIRTIVGFVLVVVGFYSFYDTLSGNSQNLDSSSMINSEIITNSLFMNIIQSSIIGIGVIVFGSGIRSRRK